jgi:hypothetical protein
MNETDALVDQYIGGNGTGDALKLECKRASGLAKN